MHGRSLLGELSGFLALNVISNVLCLDHLLPVAGLLLTTAANELLDTAIQFHSICHSIF